MGLQYDKKYSSESLKTLRYGKLMIMADQDLDGLHIKGLIINFIQSLWPELLKEEFLFHFITPILKARKGSETIAFFSMQQFEQWKSDLTDAEIRKYTLKYYKGLGTSTNKEAKIYFSDLDLHMKTFDSLNDDDEKALDLAFNKKKANERKDWMREFTEQPISYTHHSMPISKFINTEFIQFSISDCIRSIPKLIDGFKPVQRKILYGMTTRKSKAELNVSKLYGTVAEATSYHHGEASLNQGIIKMAQNFVGSNNINLLLPNGQFGSRRELGKDHASSRYISTKLSSITRHIFNELDDCLVNRQVEDSVEIEYEFFVLIIPMILVNGCEGIGTGWSTTVPNYNPLEIIDNCILFCEEKEMKDLVPWYREFNGMVVLGKNKEGVYNVFGKWRWLSDKKIEVAEIPFDTWIQSYKLTLQALIQAKVAKNFFEYPGVLLILWWNLNQSMFQWMIRRCGVLWSWVLRFRRITCSCLIKRIKFKDITML